MADKHIAIIDLGSNSCRLVVFAVGPQRSFRLVDQVSERVRIGEGGFGDARLQPAPMARTVQLLKMYHDLCEANRIERVIAVATSAVRDAVNCDEFLELARRGAGLELRVLSGAEEAYYAYLGAINSLPFTDGYVADLGGGSLELTRVQARMPAECLTLPLGAVRLSERYWSGGDSISPKDERALIEHIDAQLSSAGKLRAKAREQLVLIGGTARALANMDKTGQALPVDRLHGFELSYDFLHAQMKTLLKASMKERTAMEGLSGERADIMPAGVTVLARLMKHTGADAAIVSGQGLREGLFYEEYLLGGADQPAQSFAAVPPQLGLPLAIARVALAPNVQTLGIANIGYHYQIDWAHAEHVCRLALLMFDQLGELHGYGAAERQFLGAAAILHDIGIAVDYYRHHRHSAYLIENADLPGFSHREIALIALLVRWHRQGTPKLELYSAVLGAEDRERLRKLAAILRLAEDLERSRVQTVMGVRCAINGGMITIEAQTRGAAEAELWAANRNDDIFQTVFQRRLRVTALPGDATLPANVAEPANLMERARQIEQLLEGARL